MIDGDINNNNNDDDDDDDDDDKEMILCIGAARGGDTGNVPPLPKLKKLLQKNDVISEGSIFSNNFSKNR